MLPPEIAATVEPRRVNDPAVLGDDRSLYAVVDGGIGEESFLSLVQGADERGLQIVSPLTARLLWGYGAPALWISESRPLSSGSSRYRTWPPSRSIPISMALR